VNESAVAWKHSTPFLLVQDLKFESTITLSPADAKAILAEQRVPEFTK
jgi:hypothetical protein